MPCDPSSLSPSLDVSTSDHAREPCDDVLRAVCACVCVSYPLMVTLLDMSHTAPERLGRPGLLLSRSSSSAWIGIRVTDWEETSYPIQGRRWPSLHDDIALACDFSLLLVGAWYAVPLSAPSSPRFTSLRSALVTTALSSPSRSSSLRGLWHIIDAHPSHP